MRASKASRADYLCGRLPKPRDSCCEVRPFGLIGPDDYVMASPVAVSHPTNHPREGGTDGGRRVARERASAVIAWPTVFVLWTTCPRWTACKEVAVVV